MKPVSARQALLEVLKDIEPITTQYRHIVFVQKKKHCNVYLNGEKVCKTDANIYTMTAFFLTYPSNLAQYIFKTTSLWLDDDLQAYQARTFSRPITEECVYFTVNVDDYL